jgi:hypothetical protein
VSTYTQRDLLAFLKYPYPPSRFTLHQTPLGQRLTPHPFDNFTVF